MEGAGTGDAGVPEEAVQKHNPYHWSSKSFNPIFSFSGLHNSRGTQITDKTAAEWVCVEKRDHVDCAVDTADDQDAVQGDDLYKVVPSES